jgi:hypothetical protein
MRVGTWVRDGDVFRSNLLFDHCKLPHKLFFQAQEPFDRDVISNLMGEQIHQAQLEHDMICKTPKNS